MPDLAALEEGETDLVAFPMDWPEMSSLQLPGPALSGLDQEKAEVSFNPPAGKDGIGSLWRPA
jgi:hypothetical protein